MRPRRVVAISHAGGAGGDRVGRLVAEGLDFRFVDEEIITLAAGKEGLDPEVVADAERRKGLLARLVENLGRAGTVGAAGIGEFWVPEAGGLAGSSDLRELIIDAIRETAARGDVVIVSHAASIPLAGRDDLLRVFVTASLETRVRRLAAARRLAEAEAARRVKESDAGRADYFQRFYGIERELPTHYDLTVNTDVLTFEEAAALVVHAARPGA